MLLYQNVKQLFDLLLLRYLYNNLSTFLHFILFKEFKTYNCSHNFSKTCYLSLMIFSYSNKFLIIFIIYTPISGSNSYIDISIRYCLLMSNYVLIDASSNDF